jgi:BlaI family penicillinase repressor
VKDVWETAFPNQEKAYTTVQTYMDRMVEKGFLAKRKLGLVNFYTAAINQEILMKQATENLISRAFNGSIGQLAAFLINDCHLSASDLQEIKSLIEQKEQSK